MKLLHGKAWPWLMVGIAPALFGLLQLLVVGPDGGPGMLVLFFCVDAVGPVCFGVGVAKLRKPDGSARIGAAILAGIACFIFSLVFLVFAGGAMYGM